MLVMFLSDFFAA